VEKKGRQTIVMNGKPWKRDFDQIWEPVFSPDGSKVLVRSIDGGKYIRRVLPITEITG
jgi:hypothetical protein